MTDSELRTKNDRRLAKTNAEADQNVEHLGRIINVMDDNLQWGPIHKLLQARTDFEAKAIMATFTAEQILVIREATRIGLNHVSMWFGSRCRKLLDNKEPQP
jgi:hypothetical protein